METERQSILRSIQDHSRIQGLKKTLSQRQHWPNLAMTVVGLSVIMVSLGYAWFWNDKHDSKAYAGASATTLVPTDITSGSAVLHGSGGVPRAIASGGFEWGYTDTYGQTTSADMPLGYAYKDTLMSSNNTDDLIGLAIDGNNRIVTADRSQSTIKISDLNGTLITQFGGPGTAEGQLNEPRGPAVDDANNIYVIDEANYRIQKFNSDGNFIMTWGWGVQDGSNTFQVCVSGCQPGYKGGGDGQFSNDPSITIGHDGSIMVADSGNYRIQKFDNSGNFLMAWGWGVQDGSNQLQTCYSNCKPGLPGNGVGQFAEQTGGIVIDSNNNVYVARTYGGDGNSSGRVQKFDSNGGLITEFHTSTGMDSPYSLAIRNDHLYTGHYGTGITETDLQGNFIQLIIQSGYGGEVAIVGSLAFDSQDNLYISDITGDHGSIKKFERGLNASLQGLACGSSYHYRVFTDYTDSTREYGNDQTFTTLADCAAQTRPATAVSNTAATLNGEVHTLFAESVYSYGFDWGTSANYGRTMNGLSEPIPGSFGSVGQGAGQMSLPIMLDHDGAGNIYVDDSGNYRIQKFDSKGNFLMTWGWGVQDGSNQLQVCYVDCRVGINGNGAGQLTNDSASIVVDQNTNYIYVADEKNMRVQKFDNTGHYILEFGSSGNGSGQFNEISDITIDSSSYIYVIDSSDLARVQKFDENGNYVTQWGSKGDGDGQFGSLEDNSLGSDSQYIYVGDADNHRIQKFDHNGNYIAQWSAGDGQFGYQFLIASDESNNLYVSDIYNGRVLKYTNTGTLIEVMHFNFYTGGMSVHGGNMYLSDPLNGRILFKLTSPISSNLSHTLDGLACSTTYHYRAYVETNNGIFRGDDTSFTTAACSDTPLTVNTNPATNITAAGATVNGSVTPAAHTTLRGFQYGSSTSYGHNTSEVASSGYNFNRQWGNGGMGEGDISGMDIASDPNGNVFAFNIFTSKVYKYDRDGNLLTSWGGDGTEPGQFHFIQSIDTDSTGNVYTTEGMYSSGGEARVQKFDNNGNFVTEWGGFGQEPGNLGVFNFVTIDRHTDEVYITSQTNTVSGWRLNLQRFSAEGAYLATIYAAPGPDSGTGHTAIDSEGTIYFADYQNNRILIFSHAGNQLAAWDTAFSPTDIVIDNDNRIYIVDSANGQVQELDRNGNSIGQWNKLESNDVFSNYLMAISISNSGVLYALDLRQAGVIQQFVMEPTFFTSLSNLSCNTTYHYRAYAVSSSATEYGEDKVFTTAACDGSAAIDFSLVQTLLTSGSIASGQTATYHFKVTNETSTSSYYMGILMGVLPDGFSLDSNTSNDVVCTDYGPANAIADPGNFDFGSAYGTRHLFGCMPANVDFNNINPDDLTPLQSGQSIEWDVTGTASADFINNISDSRSLYLDFNESDFLLQYGEALNNHQDPFLIQANNVSRALYAYPTPTPPPTPAPTPAPTPTGSVVPTASPRVNTSPRPSVTVTPGVGASPSPSPSPTPTPMIGGNSSGDSNGSGSGSGQTVSPAPVKVNDGFGLGERLQAIVGALGPNAIYAQGSLIILLVVLALFYLYQSFQEHQAQAQLESVLGRYRLTKQLRSDFVNIVSHYLNTPIQTMQGALELANKDLPDMKTVIQALAASLGILREDVAGLLKTASQTEVGGGATSHTASLEAISQEGMPHLFRKPGVWVPVVSTAALLVIFNVIVVSVARAGWNPYTTGVMICLFVAAALFVAFSYRARWRLKTLSQRAQGVLDYEKQLDQDRMRFITQTSRTLRDHIAALKTPAEKLIATGKVPAFSGGLGMMVETSDKLSRIEAISSVPVEGGVMAMTPWLSQNLPQIEQYVKTAGLSFSSSVDSNVSAPLDVTSLSQLTSSLIGNAVKFTKSGSVALSVKGLNGKAGGGMELTVTDTGVGIEADKLKAITTPFTRGTNVLAYDYEGIGLSLYIDRLIVERAGGALDITSKPGSGTRVRVRV